MYYKTKSHFKNAGFPLQTVRINHHTTNAWHMHDFFELVIITSGECTHQTDDESYTVSAGDVFVIKPGRPHRYESPTPFALINLLYHPDALGLPAFDLTSSPGYLALFELEPRLRAARGLNRHLRLDPAALERVVSEADRLDAELAGQTPGHCFSAAAIFFGIVAYLSEYFSDLTRHRGEDTGIFELSRILSYLERNYADKIDFEQLARKSSVSRATLYRLFVRTTGGSPLHYLSRLRLAHAESLLLNTDLPVGEIAARTGFPDSNYFARMFRRRTGCSPTRFRSRKDRG